MSPELALREFLRMLPLVWLNKKAISKHTVDGAKCISCRTCVKNVPGGRDPSGETVCGSGQMPGLFRLPE